MNPEKAVALVALGWLAAAWLLMVRVIRRGRDLAEEIATRHPEAYERLGRPRPGYLDSIQRTRFAQFVARREFQELADPPLSERFEEHRKFEARVMAALLVTLGAIALLLAAVRHAA